MMRQIDSFVNGTMVPFVPYIYESSPLMGKTQLHDAKSRTLSFILLICNPIGDERGVIQGSRCRLVPALRFCHAEPKAVAGVNVTWYLKSMNCAHKISRVVQISHLARLNPRSLQGIRLLLG